MPINSRAKGAVGERELVQELLRRGVMCHRSVQYCGRNGDADIVCDGLNLHIEVKRTEKLRLAEAVAQASRDARSKPWIIIHRQSRGPWLVIQTLDAWSKDSAAFAIARCHRDAVVAQVMPPDA